jgi:hypothetical protein
MRNTAAVLLQSISGVSAINPLVAFYDIHGGKREVLFFYFVPDTTRDYEYTLCYFKVVTLIIGNLFRVRLPYLLLIRRCFPNIVLPCEAVISIYIK